MATINQLNALDTLQGGDLLPVYDTSNGDARKSSVSTLQSYLQDSLNFAEPTETGQFTTQYASPAATGFSVQINQGSESIHLILTPLAGYATGTIVLPLNTGLIDKQEVLVNCTQQVTTLTVDKNGATALVGAPTSLGADDFFRIKYDSLTGTWYRVG